MECFQKGLASFQEKKTNVLMFSLAFLFNLAVYCCTLSYIANERLEKKNYSFKGQSLRGTAIYTTECNRTLQ